MNAPSPAPIRRNNILFGLLCLAIALTLILVLHWWIVPGCFGIVGLLAFLQREEAAGLGCGFTLLVLGIQLGWLFGGWWGGGIALGLSLILAFVVWRVVGSRMAKN